MGPTSTAFLDIDKRAPKKIPVDGRSKKENAQYNLKVLSIRVSFEDMDIATWPGGRH